MTKIFKTTLAFALITISAGAANADEGHHNVDKAGTEQTAVQTEGAMGSGIGSGMGGEDMVAGDHHQMMQNMMKMMMKMHGNMMDGGMAQPMPMAQDMMSQMQGSMMERFDANADGSVSPDEARDTLTSMHSAADTNGDGSLSLEEFEKMHSEIIRTMMVDRFQHLDSDGDGVVTADEMTAPADRMGMHPQAQGMMGDAIDSQEN